jgi:hypothetical protein
MKNSLPESGCFGSDMITRIFVEIDPVCNLLPNRFLLNDNFFGQSDSIYHTVERLQANKLECLRDMNLLDRTLFTAFDFHYN